MARMAAYCRVSTDKAEQQSSLENQKRFFEQYAEKTGDRLITVYADEGISGKSMKKRDAFMQLLTDAEKGAFDYVAVKDISRFARNTSDFLYGIRTLRSYGIDVRFLSSNQTVIGESEFILTIFAALAQEESANLSKRVIFGKRQNAKRGRVPNIIYGYDKIDTFTLAVNPEEGAIVKLIYKWYIEGDGSRRIAIKLNEMGIPTKKNAKWIPQTVRRILQNPVYAGKLINNKSETKDFLTGTRKELPQEEWYLHERPELQLISPEDFELVQQKLTERREQYKNAHPGHRYSSRHIFSNLIRCGVCGGGFTAKVYQWKNSYVRYRCAAHNNGNAYCKNNVTIDEQELLKEIKKYLLSVIEDKKSFARQLIRQYQHESKNIDALQAAKSKERLIRRKDKLRNLYVEGLLSMEDLKSEYDRIDEGIKKIDAELAGYGEEQGNPGCIVDVPNNIEEILMNNEFTNEDMRAVIEKIIVYPDRSVEIFMK